MPRLPFTQNPNTPYHLAARSNNRDWFAIPLSQVWTIFCDYLWFVHHAHKVRIHSFVLMHNHFHLIASFPDGNLSSAMNYLMRETSRVLAFESQRINHVYGARVFRSCLGSNHYFEHAYKYVYRNPVEAGLCQRVEEYPFSTLSGLLGQHRLQVPVEQDALLFDAQNFRSHLEWLNTAPSIEDRNAVGAALRRAQFKLPNGKTTNRMSPLEDMRY